ncbi:MAG: MBL fold metallo-hydrolase [Ktedonobacteraceae bacterium]
MRVYKYIHSCLVVEQGDEKILFDPGIFSFIEGAVRPETFKDISTVILTHQHPDHVDMNALKQIVALSNASVITNSEGKTALAKEGIEARVVEEGNHQTKNFTIRALSSDHAAILSPTLPQNTAYILNDTFLNPGDSFASYLNPLKGIKVLALPVMAPWLTELTVTEFAERISPQMVVPVHDGYVKDFFIKQRYDNYSRHFSAHGMKFQYMSKPGDAVDIE